MDQKDQSNNIFRGSSAVDLRHNQPQQQHQPPPPPQQPAQKCPRCDSLNTKFCYYNNYSLSQPRYFCKTCRRYWTQGGTLRNVPVGGGCRKGSKRAKTTATSTSTSTAAAAAPSSSTSAETHQPPPTGGGASMSTPYFPGGGGFLSSLAAIQSLGGSADSVSNLGFLQGFGILPPFASQLQAQQLFQMGGGTVDGSKSLSLDNSSSTILHQPPTGPPPPAASSSSAAHDWISSQGLIPRNPSSGGDSHATGLWSIGTGAASTATGDGHSTAHGDGSRWPNLPGYGGPQ